MALKPPWLVKGKFHMNNFLVLKHVLHVPNLSTNLLSIHQLIKETKVSCNFFYPLIVYFINKIQGRQLDMPREDKLPYHKLLFN